MDKKPFSLLEYFSNISQNGEYVVFEKKEILNSVKEISDVSLEELEQLVRYLETKKLINIRLMDSRNIVLKMTKEGETFARLDSKHLRSNSIIETQGGVSSGKMLRRVFLTAFLGAFLGGSLAATIIYYIIHFLQ